ncbi:hypothetical protein ACXIUT_16685 [Achromobacter denitrificans]
MDKFERGATVELSGNLSEGELRARRTLEAARRLMEPDADAPDSSVEAELQRYVKQAYRRHSYG